MAFRSIAQMEKFKQLVASGAISKQVFDEWMKGTIVSNLPKKIDPKNSPDNAEHVKLTKRHARKQRKRRSMPKKPKARTKRKEKKQRKQRTMPI